MHEVIVGQTITEGFGTGQAGEVFTRTASQIDGVSVVWEPDIDDLTGGAYDYSYTPTESGMHSWVGLSSITSTVLSINFMAIEADEEEDEGDAAGHNSLAKIRLRVADMCNDLVEFRATSTSPDTSIFYDVVAGRENDDHFRGTELWFDATSGTAANRGKIVRVLGSDGTNGTLSLSAGLVAAPVIDDIAYGFNVGGEGTSIRKYDRYINDAIRSLGRGAVVAYSEELDDLWDQYTPWIDIPETFVSVSGVQYLDGNGVYNDVPSYNLEFDLVNKQLTLTGNMNSYANQYAIRINGFKKHPTLSSDTDSTDIDFGWLTTEAAAHILLGRRNQLEVNKGGQLRNEAMLFLGKASPLANVPDVVRVR